MTNPIVITRDTVKRPWAELEPKIAIALITGFLAVIALILAKSVGVKLPDEVKEVIPFAFAILCGYFTKSSGTTITQFGNDGSKVVESHRGPTESILTGSIPVQPAAPISTPLPADDQATAVMPSRASDAFAQSRWAVPAPTAPNTATTPTDPTPAASPVDDH